MTTVELNDLEAAYRLAKVSGKSMMPMHLFVVAELLAAKREQMAASNLERDAREFVAVRRAR